jgi:hypothetical protein
VLPASWVGHPGLVCGPALRKVSQLASPHLTTSPIHGTAAAA